MASDAKDKVIIVFNPMNFFNFPCLPMGSGG